MNLGLLTLHNTVCPTPAPASQLPVRSEARVQPQRFGEHLQLVWRCKERVLRELALPRVGARTLHLDPVFRVHTVAVECVKTGARDCLL